MDGYSHEVAFLLLRLVERITDGRLCICGTRGALQTSDVARGLLETEMPDGVAQCLMLVNGGGGVAETLTSALGRRGVRVTRAVQPRECLDLLATRRWGCLAVDADGAADEVLDVLSQSRRVHPEVPVLVLVRHGDTRTAVQAMKAGAADCVETPIDTARLVAAVIDLCRQAADASSGCHDPLTPMERTVLEHVLAGRTNQQIADMLCRSPRTIEVHRHHIMKKLGVSNLVELVKQAMHVVSRSPVP